MQSMKRSAKAQNIVQILIFKEHMLRKKNLIICFLQMNVP